MKTLLVNGNALHIPLADQSVHMVVTSPPYWGLRDYGTPGQLGLEPTPDEYVANTVAVFREVKRILRDDGVLFLNMGDSYYSSQSSVNYAIIREDLTEEEYYAAAVGIRRYMPELWRTCWGETGQGSLPEMLPEEIQGRTSRKDAGTQSEILSQRPEEILGSNSQTVGGKESSGDSANGREMCLLWGDRTNISLPRPHQGEWAKRLSESGWDKGGLEEGNSRRITEGQISPSLLELQFGIRFIRFLSSLKLDFSRIPAPIKIYFREIKTLKPKDLCGIPWRLAFALQADGWYLRSDIIWSKPNPMPESVTDRPTKAHEYVFLLAKRERYFWDQDAVREPIAESTAGDHRLYLDGYEIGRPQRGYPGDPDRPSRGSGLLQPNPAGRNIRTVWTIATQPTPEAHFATYPEALVEPCIKAGTSERGVCPKCGKQWVRVIEREVPPIQPLSKVRHTPNGTHKAIGQKYNNWLNEHPSTTTGFRPDCDCYPRFDEWREYPPQGKKTDEEYERLIVPIREKRAELMDFWQPMVVDNVPAIVFDPFIGSGTTARVAQRLGRRCIGLELSPEYLEIARNRTGITAWDEWVNGKKDGAVLTDLPLFGGVYEQQH